MKLFYSGLVVCALSSLTASAQQAITVNQHYKPRQAAFTRFPQRFEIDEQPMRKVFASEINDTVTIRLSRNQHFKGVVTDKVQLSPILQTINIRSTEIAGAMMHISLNTAADAKQPLRARIMHPQRSDVMVLSREASKLVFTKEEAQFLITE